MAKTRDAAALAESLVAVANGAGLPTTALLTDMNQPLALAAGNAVEVRNAVDFLTGDRRDGRLEEVTLSLAAEMLVTARLAGTPREAMEQARAALESGRAADVFGRMVALLGGPNDFVSRAAHYLPAAPVVREVPSPEKGFVGSIETRDLGLAVVALGGGRTRPEDAVDHAVGLTALQPIGAEMERGDPLALVHARDEAAAEAAVRAVQAAYGFVPLRPRAVRPVKRRIVGS
jgi:thymidine phosphorylase